MWLGKECCNATWEPEASIPPCGIREYELGLEPEVIVQSVSIGGQTNHTLHVHAEDAQPKTKKQKFEDKRYETLPGSFDLCYSLFPNNIIL